MPFARQRSVMPDAAHPKPVGLVVSHHAERSSPTLGGPSSFTHAGRASPKVAGPLSSNSAGNSGALTALAISGGYLYIAGGLGTVGGHSYVKEVAVSTGSLVRTISGPSYDFSDPEAVLSAGTDLLVLDSGSNTITEFPKPR